MKLKNILMVTMSLDIGGAETHLVELSLALAKMGYRIVIASNGGVYTKQLEENGIPHYTLPLNNKNPYNMLKSFFGLHGIIKKENIQVVHAHARIPAFISGFVCRQKKIPLVTTVHGTYVVNGFLSHITNWGEKTIAVSEDIKSYLMENYQICSNNIFLTINGIDTKRFAPAPPSPSLLQEFKLEDGETRLLYLGRLSPDSGEYAFHLLDIVPELYMKISNLRVIIVGHGPLFPDLKEKAEALNQSLGKEVVILTGGRTDIPQLISLSHGVIALSRAALEAMSCEKPVLLAGNYGYMGVFTPEKLEDCIKNNFTARDCKKPSLSVFLKDCITLLQLPEEEKNNLKAFCRNTVLAHYSVDRMANDADSVYQLLSSPINQKKYDFSLLGYYGFNNSGDDALLLSIVSNLRCHNPHVSLNVLTNHTQEAYFDLGADTYYRFNPFRIISALYHSRVLIFGGGNLIQDVTSSHSLFYYIAILKFAQMLGLRTMLYSNGIGPISKPLNRKLVGWVLNKTDVITLRESNSLAVLTSCGVHGPTIQITADETLTMTCAKVQDIQPMLIALGLDLSRPILGVSARLWKKNPKDFSRSIAQGLDQLAKTFHCQILFLPMHLPSDLTACQQIEEQMEEPCFVLTQALDPPTFIGVISQITGLIGMRLHSLIYSVCAGIPMAGVVYDPKVTAFLNSVEESNYILVEDLTSHSLFQLGKRLFTHYEENQTRVLQAREHLHQLAQENSALAMKLLEDSLCEF